MTNPFIGGWELIATERVDAQGNTIGEAMPGYTGQIMYSDDGHMSAHLMGGDRPRPAGDNRLLWPLEDKARAFETYIGYYGSYTIDEAAGVVTHHVAGSSSPAMVGTDQPRQFRFDQDRLILSPPPRDNSGERSFIIWRRL